MMRNRVRGSLSVAVLGVALACAAALAPAASASISPAVTLDQSAGTAAGSTVALGLDVKFNPASGDSPKDLTVSLPPGLLSNASIDGGACLTMHPTAPVPACQIASGTATAAGFGLASFSAPVTLDLVAPPKAGELAGIAIFLSLADTTAELGTPGDVTIRPSNSPTGVGVDIAFANIPNSFGPASVAVDELDTTFSGLRMPASCPPTPANVSVSANSYDDSTAETASAPLHVTNCSGLPFAPKFAVTATKDNGDTGVEVATEITQAAGEATSRSVALALPQSVLTPNGAAVLSGGILCSTPTLAGCKPIGSASATSPLYPRPLAGQAYLTGSPTAPAITIAFPAPFALTLTGSVNLATNTTTFNNLPDIPLSDLRVTLAGGPDAVFVTDCKTPSGTASSTLITQNGDRTLTDMAPLSLSNCSAGSGGGGSGNPPAVSPAAKLTAAAISGLARGKPKLRLAVSTGPNAAKLRAFTIALPRGLRFVGHRHGGRLLIRGMTLGGTKAKTIALNAGKLVVTLRKPLSRVIFAVGARGLKESLNLKHSVKNHRIKRLNLSLSVKNTAGKTTVLRARVGHLG